MRSSMIGLRSVCTRRLLRTISARVSAPSVVRAAPSTPLRFCATNPSASRRSAVNVEDFTLNDDVVQADMDSMARWNELAEALDAQRAAGDHAKLLEEVERGLALLEELGPLNAPIQCETLLCMEGSQAFYNMGDFAKALEYAQRAKKVLMACSAELRDNAQIAEIDQFIGFILTKYGRPGEAQEVFEAVLRWIDGDAKTAMPMQAVAAVNLRHTVVTGLGESFSAQADALMKDGDTTRGRELYNKALDLLIEALNQHIDENSFTLVKSTLRSILHCFEGLSDGEQAVSTCRKYVSWCDRHDDTSGAQEGKKMLQEVCKTFNIENPLEASEPANTA